METKVESFSSKDLQWLRRAEVVAQMSECRHRVGAVVVSAGRVLSWACNKDYNDVLILEEEKVRDHASLCAERRALRQCDPQATDGAVVYVVRVKKDGSYGTSLPCDRCVPVLNDYGVKRVVCVREE